MTSTAPLSVHQMPNRLLDGSGDERGGAGSALHPALILSTGFSTLFATFVSIMSIYFHLKNYRKPLLQRMVVRIMLMVPIYGIASFISLISLEAAFFIDLIRDIYEAFVIYCFFNLLLGYLGGERSLLILLHGREPKQSVFPISIFRREIDVSDPYTFLFLKRGILQYVQVKPILAVASMILKILGKYNEGDLRANSGYLYVSIVYNTSICLSLYCLAMFWMCVNEDLLPFRPMPKFLCVKGILFFSFWQSILVSILVAAGAIASLGPYTDTEHISLGLTDMLICYEMPLFAIAHMYAFSHTDYIDKGIMYAARMPMYYALRDAFGLKDVVEDSKTTLRGEGMDYREFEPAEGFIHQGSGRDRRIKAGLRYSQGGKQKYWLPMPAESALGRDERTVNTVVSRVVGGEEEEEVYAPLLEDQARAVVHDAPGLNEHSEELLAERTGFDLPFEDPDAEDDELYAHSKHYLFGDYHYPTIDVSSEDARKEMWDEEERVLRDERGAYFSPLRGARGLLSHGGIQSGYGAVTRPEGRGDNSHRSGQGKGKARNAEPTVPVIDHEHDRLPDVERGGVRLDWQRQSSGARVLRGSRPSTPPARLVDDGSRGSSCGSPASRSPVTTPEESPRRGRKHELPPDAVDLVVESGRVAEAEMTRERRKGEPAIRGSGLRKVYVQEYHAPEEAKAGVEAEDGGSDSEESEAGEAGRVVGIEEVGADVPVARAATPPPHARVGYHVPHDENPWV